MNMNQREDRFIKTVKDFYKKQGRHDLPWRKTKDPYRILVSEIMLQQTQVERVIPKYKDFIKKWPTAAELAKASLGGVLKEWQGLGYNRRAKMLYQTAKAVAGTCQSTCQQKFPQSNDELKELPGIGPYTAGAVMAFAYNKPMPIIETNIRTAFLHHFFKNQSDVDDTAIMRLVERTLDQKNPREWYWALMDYGTHLKKEFGNPNKKSKHYAKQSKFAGSDRQIRGAIVRALSRGQASKAKLRKDLIAFDTKRVEAQMQKLLAEGMVIKKGRSFSLPE